MLERPSQVWKGLSAERRQRVAAAFWTDRDAPDIDDRRLEVVTSLATRLKFRPKSIRGLPVAERARMMARFDVSDAVATRALVAYHLADQRPLMGAFLDALGIPHENGLITAERIETPGSERLAGAVSAVRATFDPADVDVYLRTLAAVDSDTWANLSGLPGSPV